METQKPIDDSNRCRKPVAKDFFLDALRNLIGIFVNLAKGVFYAVKNNIPWAIILVLFIFFHIIRIGQMRTERDALDHKCIQLEQKLDSLQPKNISYLPFKE